MLFISNIIYLKIFDKTMFLVKQVFNLFKLQ